MPSPTDRTAIVAGGGFLVLAASGLLNSTGLAPHSWGWPVAVIVVAIAMAIAGRTLHALVQPTTTSEAS